jgi:hypothetical protein
MASACHFLLFTASWILTHMSSFCPLPYAFLDYQIEESLKLMVLGLNLPRRKTLSQVTNSGNLQKLMCFVSDCHN